MVNRLMAKGGSNDHRLMEEVRGLGNMTMDQEMSWEILISMESLFRKLV